jgi:hypothetical protein
MTACVHTFAFSPRVSREFHQKRPALQSEGAGNAGRNAPAAWRAEKNSHTSVVTTVTPEIPGIPRAME